jgi:hypothetical protein
VSKHDHCLAGRILFMANIRELITFGGLDDTIQDQDVAVGLGLEDEYVLWVLLRPVSYTDR